MKHEDARISISEYQRSLDEGLSALPELSSQTVRYWSDFARVFYHPRSIVQIIDYELGSTIMPFEKWNTGEDLFSELDKEHDLLDRDIRVWAEECDQMQGIQVFTGADDAWGGFASKYIENVRDEYGKTAIWVWGLEKEEGQGQRAKQSLRAINIAQSLAQISPQTSMYIPLGIPSQLPPYVHLDSKSQWHVSALLSLVVESMTLPSRQKLGTGRRGFLSDMEAALNTNGNQRIASLQSSVIDPSAFVSPEKKLPNVRDDPRVRESDTNGVVFEDELEEANSKLDMSFSTGKPSQSALSIRQWEKSNHVFGKVESIRGLFQQEFGLDEGTNLQSRKRRRLAALPVVDKYVHEILDHSLPSLPADGAWLDTTPHLGILC